MAHFIVHNVSQLGAVCVGLWVGNCAKVLLYSRSFSSFFVRGIKFYSLVFSQLTILTENIY